MHRKPQCACGGGCPRCQEHATPQPKLTVRTPGDPFEREADHIAAATVNVSQVNDPVEIEADQTADRVVRMPGSVAANAKGSDGVFRIETNTYSPIVHAKHSSVTSSAAIDGDLGSRINSGRGNGRSLDSNTRGVFEPRFGASLERVRIHADGEAATLNRKLSAKAFTIGNDIFFGAGQYQSDTESGKRLLAHELVHVSQRGNEIRRCKDSSDEAKYDSLIAEIKALDGYKTLDPDAKDRADTIIKEGKDKPDCLYYARKLKVLFTTPVESSAHVATEIRKETAAAVKTEQERLETKEAKETLDVEEAATADPEPESAPAGKPAEAKKPGRTWTTYPTRFGGGSYKADATDPLNILVKVKVNLVPGGAGTWDDVKNTKSLEDAIEKHASRKGFRLNLEFVNPENKPDFVADAETVTINANPKWPNATNWGGDARTCAHELFHVLNFPEDRYNYIESHSTNKKMAVSERLLWFLRQMHKPAGFDKPESLMASGQYPIEEDVCTIARLDMAICLKVREKLAPVVLDFRIRFSGGFASVAGTAGMFAGAGFDVGIPLNHERDWMLFVGVNGSMLSQLSGDHLTAFLAGGRLGLEKRWSSSTGGAVLGLFGGGGAAFVGDKGVSGSATSYLPGGYGEVGLLGGYKFSDLTLEAEAGIGSTTRIELHDPSTGRADPQTLQWFQAGLKASLVF